MANGRGATTRTHGDAGERRGALLTGETSKGIRRSPLGSLRGQKGALVGISTPSLLKSGELVELLAKVDEGTPEDHGGPVEEVNTTKGPNIVYVGDSYPQNLDWTCDPVLTSRWDGLASGGRVSSCP